MQLMNGNVLTCHAEECSYNDTMRCMAERIVVGSDHSVCDTFTTGPAQMVGHEARVKDCSMTMCDFNDDMSCEAAGITVDRHSGHADCATYRAV